MNDIRNGQIIPAASGQTSLTTARRNPALREDFESERFDYEDAGCTPAEADACRADTRCANDWLRRSRTATFEAAVRIARVHKVLARKKTGSFGRWAEIELPIGRRWADQLRYLPERFSKVELSSNFDLKAACLLAAPSCPVEATEEAKRKARSGDHISFEKAREIIKVVAATIDGKPVTAHLEAPSDANRAVVKPAPKPSKATDFNVAEIEAQAARRNGKEIITAKDRREAEKHLGAFIKFLSKAGEPDLFRDPINKMLRWIREES